MIPSDPRLRRLAIVGLVLAGTTSIDRSIGGLDFALVRYQGGGPTVTVALCASIFRMGDTITNQATLITGLTPSKAGIHLGALEPDGVTFLALVQVSLGVISATEGSAPIPFLANVPLT